MCVYMYIYIYIYINTSLSLSLSLSPPSPSLSLSLSLLVALPIAGHPVFFFWKCMRDDLLAAGFLDGVLGSVNHRPWVLWTQPENTAISRVFVSHCAKMLELPELKQFRRCWDFLGFDRLFVSHGAKNAEILWVGVREMKPFVLLVLFLSRMHGGVVSHRAENAALWSTRLKILEFLGLLWPERFLWAHSWLEAGILQGAGISRAETCWNFLGLKNAGLSGFVNQHGWKCWSLKGCCEPSSGLPLAPAVPCQNHATKTECEKRNSYYKNTARSMGAQTWYQHSVCQLQIPGCWFRKGETDCPDIFCVVVTVISWQSTPLHHFYVCNFGSDSTCLVSLFVCAFAWYCDLRL